jgi:Protein of unknown function (DUF4232)
MNISTTTRRAVAAVALAGVAVTGSVLWVGTASATPADHLCTADEVTTALVAGHPGAGQRYAYVQFTAKPDRGCSLHGSQPVSLADAAGVTVSNDGAQGALVTIADGQSARMLLHWTGIEASQNQVTPSSITVTLPSDTAPATTVTLPWNQGALDNSAQAHSLTVSAVEQDAAPAY